jgi:hypothetical protein
LDGAAFVVNLPDSDYFADPMDKGDPVIASWDIADVNVLSKADTGTGNPYSNATH